jgi:hypothetical protein
MDHIVYLLEIWQAGVLLYSEDQLDAIRDALVIFQQKNDTKASVFMFLTYSSGQVGPVKVDQSSMHV